jgi:hypothetical protein
VDAFKESGLFLYRLPFHSEHEGSQQATRFDADNGQGLTCALHGYQWAKGVGFSVLARYRFKQYRCITVTLQGVARFAARPARPGEPVSAPTGRIGRPH